MSIKPEDVTGSQPIRKMRDDQQKMGGFPSQSFESFMDKEAQKAGTMAAPKAAAMSPFDLVRTQPQLATTANFDTLTSQVKSAQALLGDINTQLSTPNLKLKQSQRYLLRNKLTDANAHLRSANIKMGIEPPATPPSSNGGVLGKFLDYVDEGQNNLLLAHKQLSAMKAQGTSINPSDFLQIQVKLAHAQQEIEYASIMLAKAIEDIKMLFNVQI